RLARFFGRRVLRSARPTDEARRQLDEYFARERREFDLPVDLRPAREFGRIVLEELARVPYGEVTTYGALAAKAGRARAARAVGGIVYAGCTLAVTADALQGTWMTIDGYVTGAGHAALFGTQTPVNDYQVCSQGFNITRSKNAVPPSVAVMQAVLDFFFK